MVPLFVASAFGQGLGELKGLSLEQLTAIEVTSVSRRNEKLVEAAAAVEVLTGDRILRAGAHSLPDALRLATGLQVSQLDGREWTISSRGFATIASSKMEVNQDGRSLYGPLFSGVLWDVQTTILDDLDRIEVIRGPGAALWGANAVNGVISIVSKPARETQGTLVRAVAGTTNREFAVRYGGTTGPRSYFRVAAQGLEADGLRLANTADAGDDRRLLRFSGRWDAQTAGDAAFTLQSGVYRGLINQFGQQQSTVQGGHLNARIERKLSEAVALSAFATYEHTERRIPLTYSEIRDTGNIEFEAAFQNTRHAAVLGVRARVSADRIGSGAALGFVPSRSTIRLYSLYGQERYTFADPRWRLTLGSTLEHNTFTSFEFQPTMRLSFSPASSWMTWVGASHAVRTPSRIETDVRFAGPAGTTLLAGSRSFGAEELDALEAGVRWHHAQSVVLDLSAFSNRYDHLRSIEPAGGTTIFINRNLLNARTSGFEASATLQAREKVRLILGMRYLDKTLQLEAQSRSPNTGSSEGNDARTIATAQLSIDLPSNLQFDAVIRHVSELPLPRVRAYTAVDLRLAWRPSRAWEFALSGRDLFTAPHAEAVQGSTPVELVRPAGTISLTWQR